MSKIIRDVDILESAARESMAQILRKNSDLRLSTYEDNPRSLFILKRSRPVCQVSFWYCDYFCRVINWAAIVHDVRNKGIFDTNVDDDSPQCTLVRRAPDCVDRFEKALERCVDDFRGSPERQRIYDAF